MKNSLPLIEDLSHFEKIPTEWESIVVFLRKCKPQISRPGQEGSGRVVKSFLMQQVRIDEM